MPAVLPLPSASGPLPISRRSDPAELIDTQAPSSKFALNRTVATIGNELVVHVRNSHTQQRQEFFRPIFTNKEIKK